MSTEVRVVGGAALVALALVIGCPGEIDDPTPFLTGTGGSTGCIDVVTELFPQSCLDAGCHNATDASAGLDLESPNVEDRLVGVPATVDCGAAPLVDPQNPEGSILYVKLTPNYCGASQMPQLKTKLTEDELACVLAWIEQQSSGASSSSSSSASAGGMGGAGGAAGGAGGS